MALLVVAASLLAIVAVLAGVVASVDARYSARVALREALERGDIRPEEYAAHLRALDDAA